MTEILTDKVPLCERRLLSLNDFCIYSGLHRDKAREFIKQHDLAVVFGPRTICIDRKKFDDWCDSYTNSGTTVFPEASIGSPSNSVSIHSLRRRGRR